MIEVSIIIVTYNSEKEIVDCLDSVLPQLVKSKSELIIVDNNSTDDTITILKDISNKLVTVYYNSENLGYTKGNNLGIEHSKGEYILFLNPDTITPSNSIQKFVHKAKNSNLSALAPQLKFPDGSIQKSCRRFPRRRDVIYSMSGLSKIFSNSREFGHWKMTDFDHKREQFVDQPASSALLIRRDVLDETGYFDEAFPYFFTDVDLCKRIIDAGYKILFDPSIHIFHIGGANYKRIRVKMIIISHISFIRYFFKHKKGILNKFINVLVGSILILILPLRILINLLLPSLRYRKRKTL